MIKYKSYAKINLSLEVLSKRGDGYHNIDSLMSRISLYDVVSFEKTSGDNINISSDSEIVPTDQSNLVYTAWEILKKYYDKNPGINIYIQKNIPIGGGLGGGTSNGVLTMKILNQLWDLGFSNMELKELATPLGADSSFFFEQGLVRVEGIGDITTDLGPSPSLYLVLLNNNKSLSSQQVYENINTYSTGKTKAIVDDLPSLDYLYKNPINSMEEAAFEIYPDLKKIKEDIRKSGAELSLMSGAGTTVFGIFEDKDKRDRVFESLSTKYGNIWKAKLR